MFSRFAWLGLLFSGVTLFMASMLIEAAVLTAFLPSALAGVALAAALEVAKATVVVLRRVAVMRDSGRAGSWLLRAMLVGFSALCSLMFLAQTMHQPEREAVRATELERLDEGHALALFTLEREFSDAERARSEIAKDDEMRAAKLLDAHHRARIDRLETGLDREMNNVVGGVFEGPRYHALERRIDAAKADYHTALTAMRDQRSTQLAEETARALAARHDRREALQSEYRMRRDRLLHANFTGDMRVENPTVHKFLEVLGAVIQPPPDAVVLVFAFSLMLALMMELGIYVAFDTLALAWAPVFQAAHRADVAVETQRIEAEQALRTEGVDDGYLRRRTARQRQRAEASARMAADIALAEA